MIKVYLDWNCITHCKDSLVELKELLQQYRHIFICPYGVAHLRDIQTNLNANPKEYEKDLDLLTHICGGHMILCNNDRLEVLNVTPREYLLDNGKDLDFLQNKFNFPYNSTRELLRIAFNPKDLHRIAVEDNPQNVIPLINSIVKKNLHVFDSIDALLKQTSAYRENTLEMRIKEIYFALDMLGYKSEAKTKSFSNIDTDAHHIANACICDYLISNDKKMRDKTKAIYSHIHCVTKVLDPQSFMKEIPKIAQQCYEDDLIPKVMSTNGIPTMQDDGAHYKALDYPLWGTFKYCYNANTLDSNMPENMAIFRPGSFMFYDELRPLATITALGLPESQREAQIEHYIQSYVQSKPIEDFAFTLNGNNYKYDCLLTTQDNLPALRVSYDRI